MRIGIDARMYGPQTRGIGRYIAQLLQELEQIDETNEYVVFLNSDGFGKYQPQKPNFKKVLANIHWYTLKEQLVWPAILRSARLDLVHFPHFNVPIFYHQPFIVTIHDLILLTHPTMEVTTLGPIFYRLKYLAYKLVLRSCLNRSQKIIAVSNSTRNEILKMWPKLKPDKILVTPLAVTSILNQKSEADSLIQTPTPFMLYVGSCFPHKNLKKLISAFALFAKENPEYNLVLITGPADFFSHRLTQFITSTNLERRVHILTNVSDSELASAYNQAQFFVFPSLAEGFGLPPLEAGAHSLPSMVSNIPIMREVMKNAALYFDPNNINEMAGAMKRLAQDVELRRELAASAQTLAKQNTWRNLARQTLKAYQQALT